MNYSRRELALLPALAVASATASPQEVKPDGKMLAPRAFRYEDLPVKAGGPNGLNHGRAVFNGETHSGFPIELHMTELAPGQMPHAPHKHVNEEVLMLRRGSLEAYYGGQTIHLTAGSVIYMASMVEHGWKNTGTEPCEYFVLALGSKTA